MRVAEVVSLVAVAATLASCRSGSLESALYRSVRAPRIGWAADEEVALVDLPKGTSREYLLRDGHLLLRVQTTYPRWGLMMVVDRTEWTPERIKLLRASHPELEGFWPAPSRDDGGVQWVSPGS